MDPTCDRRFFLKAGVAIVAGLLPLNSLKPPKPHPHAAPAAGAASLPLLLNRNP